jgi:hypothetical protein
MGPGNTDNYYADMADDFHAELYVGRFSCDSQTDCELLVAKNNGYEIPHLEVNPDWVRSATFIVRDDYDEADPVYYGDTWYAYRLMEDAGYTTLDTLFRKNNDDANDIVTSVNAGRMIVNYRGQGVSNWWNPFGINPHDTDNGFMLPLVVSATCGTGNFYDDNHVCEDWVRAGTPENPAGSIGFFGTSTVGSHVEGVRSAVDRGFYRSLFENDIKILGQVCLDAKEYLIDEQPGQTTEYKGWNLLGDPELRLWTAVPESIFANHLPIAPLGPFNFIIDVTDSEENPIEGARVCLSKNNQIHSVSFTDENGQVIIPINAQIIGDMNIVITGDNLYPYQTIVPVVTDISAVQGYVVNSETGTYLQNAKVFIESTGQYTYSDENGFYKVYIAEEGFYDLEAELFGFYSYLYADFYIVAGEIVDLNIELDPTPSTILEGYILHEETGESISTAEIKPVNAVMNPVYSDINGYYIFVDIPSDYEYEIQTSHPDFASKIKTISIPSNETIAMDFELAYIQKFEESDAGFYPGDEFGNEWEWGIPVVAGGPSAAHSGEKVWGTDLNYFYNPNADESLFSISYYLAPFKDEYKLTFYHWYEANTGWDGGNVQISTDGGENWTILFPVVTYPDHSIVALQGEAGYTGEQLEWEQVEFDLSEYVGEHVEFRFQFASTNTFNNRGWFIDDFTVHGAGQAVNSIGNIMDLSIPTAYSVSNYPNPFNPITTIDYALTASNHVELKIYDTNGKLVKILVDDEKDVGYHTVIWNGKDERGNTVNSGVYLYHITAGEYAETKRCILLK